MTLTQFQTQTLTDVLSTLKTKRLSDFKVYSNVDNELVLYRDLSDKLINLTISEENNVTLAITHKIEGKRIAEYMDEEKSLKHLVKQFIKN